MKAVLMSLKPEWCELYATGEKTLEVRKNRPKLEVPFKVYIYCTKGGDKYGYQIFVKPKNENQFKGICTGTVIGEFVCDMIEKWDCEYWNDNSVYQAISRIDYDDEGDYEWVNVSSNEDDNPSDNYLCKESCLSFEKIQRYAGNGRFYAWHISDLVIYDKPMELSEFFREGDCEGGKKCKTCHYSEKGNEAAGLEDDSIAPFDTTKRIPITRPPQSWCYVEVSNEV